MRHTLKLQWRISINEFIKPFDKFKLLEFICFLQLVTFFVLTIDYVHFHTGTFEVFLSVWVSVIYCGRPAADCRAVSLLNTDFDITSSLFQVTTLFSFIHV